MRVGILYMDCIFIAFVAFGSRDAPLTCAYTLVLDRPSFGLILLGWDARLGIVGVLVVYTI
jgi:hypothetical protein